jgi:transketolase
LFPRLQMDSASHTVLLQRELRLQLLSMYYGAKAGHIGCSLSCIDIMIATLLKNKEKDESFILSKGHAAAALYACIHRAGGISEEQINSFYKNGTTLSAHPAPGKFEDIPFATGSLGHGLPIGCGIAKANQLKKKNSSVFVLMSDGETNEGTTWEAGHFAVKHQLDNLLVIVDKNGIQGFGSTEEILGETAAAEKFITIGFETVEADGHDVDRLTEIISGLKKNKNGKPKMVIANTVKGKGVSYMESKMEWHYLPMDAGLYSRAQEDIYKNYPA